MKELSNKLRKIAYDMSFRHTPFEMAANALAAYVRQFGTGDLREDTTYKQLRETYDFERDARQAKYNKNFARGWRKAAIIDSLIATGPLFEYAELYEERKEIRAIINMLCGHTREWRPSVISALPVFPEVR